MKHLIRRLSRVADSSLRRTAANVSSSRWSDNNVAGVPEGHLPIYVGDEMKRFVVRADLLSHPILVKLLNKSAQEYGYEQPGVLRIPCHVFVFERILEAVKVGGGDELLESLADELL